MGVPIGGCSPIDACSGDVLGDPVGGEVAADECAVVHAISRTSADTGRRLMSWLLSDLLQRRIPEQDAFLPHVENGVITLIGATTENPSFEVIAPLLSRSRVFRLEQLESDELKQVVQRGLAELGARIDDDALGALLEGSRGDARVALNGLEAAAALAGEQAVGVEDRVDLLHRGQQRLEV